MVYARAVCILGGFNIVRNIPLFKRGLLVCIVSCMEMQHLVSHS